MKHQKDLVSQRLSFGKDVQIDYQSQSHGGLDPYQQFTEKHTLKVLCDWSTKKNKTHSQFEIQLTSREVRT